MLYQDMRNDLKEAVSDGVILLIHREAADDKIPLRSLLEKRSVESEARILVFPDNSLCKWQRSTTGDTENA